jgi:hypothetical protein
MTGRNWARLGNRNRMRRQGVEDIQGKTPLVLDQPPKQPRRKLSRPNFVSKQRPHSLLGAKARQPKTNSVRSLR